MNPVLDIIQNPALTYHQRVFALAKQAEDSLNVLNVDDQTRDLLNKGAICNLFEGEAPYRPRYVVPDYQRFLNNGSSFLEFDPPLDIWDAVNKLLILYKHVPSIDYFPVYLGNIDTLLDPFIKDSTEARQAIRFFLLHIDRTLTGSFVHANIGPQFNQAAKIILEVSEELETAIPNITLKYDKKETSDEFLRLAAKTALKTAKPSFANHHLYSQDFPQTDYAIASCYNGLPLGGGGYTLTRLVLNRLVSDNSTVDNFLENELPNTVNCMLQYMDERIRFLIEDAAFFQHSFLVDEGLIHQSRFVGMFGIVGLAEAVNTLLKAEKKLERFGHSKQANKLGLQIIELIDSLVKAHKSPYVKLFDGHHVLHAQVGLTNEKDISPGCRIPIGEEPETYKHILQSAPFHKYFVSGIGDIFVFEETYKKHPEALCDVIKGAMQSGLRYFSAYESDCDVVRVTGYLVKKSQLKKLKSGQAVLNQSTALAMGSDEPRGNFDRQIRS